MDKVLDLKMLRNSVRGENEVDTYLLRNSKENNYLMAVYSEDNVPNLFITCICSLICSASVKRIIPYIHL